MTATTAPSSTFQLTISSSYVSDWGIREGVREILQNALDGEQDGYPMTFRYHDKSNTLSITNAGVRLERNVWLMGVTSKADGNHRGCFGEGLKLGCLALVRCDRKVTITNDDERWAASLQPSKVFPGEQVLGIRVRRCKGIGAFRVEVEVLPEEWQEICRNFLHLRPIPVAKARSIGTDVLTDPGERGRCYVKGIFVQDKADCQYGYDFRNVRTDRDRRMIAGWEFHYEAASALISLYLDGLLTPVEFLGLLMSGKDDTRGLADRHLPWGSSKIEDLREAFFAAHGERAIPVANAAEASQVGHLGKVGVICVETAIKFFHSNLDLSVEKLISERRNDVLRTYEIDELDAVSRDYLKQAIKLVEGAACELRFSALAPRLEVVDFASGDLEGLWHGGTIRVARSVLGDWEKTLSVLVHELAHDRGGDGSVGHERAEAEIFSRIINRLSYRHPVRPYLMGPSAVAA